MSLRTRSQIALVGAGLAAFANYLGIRFGWATALLLIPAVYVLYRAYMGQLTQLKERQQRLEETEALHMRTIEGLAMAMEAKDGGTHDHLSRVRNYVQAVGEALTLDELELKALQTASFLHDIGKLAVPEHIIHKPGKLTPDEFERMKIHPGVGAEILERVRFPYPVVPIVRSHHEWWNGTGYPDGLKGEEIPIGARILTVVDCFDALVSDRPYRKGMTSSQALSLIRNLAGKQFDPAIVEIFVQCHVAAGSGNATVVESAFHPLNTNLTISRGLAPEPGFEAGAGESVRSLHGGSTAEGERGSAATSARRTVLAAAFEEAQHLLEQTQTLSASLTSGELVSLLLARLMRLVPANACTLGLRQGDCLQTAFVEGECAAQFTKRTIPLGKGISGRVAQSGEPILNGNALMEPGVPTDTDGVPKFRAALSVPLFSVQQGIFAVLTFYAGGSDTFQRDHLQVLQTMEARLSLALQHALASQGPEAGDGHDKLTGLPTAKDVFLALESELGHCRETQASLAVLACDLNAFKEVNDLRGHATGDRVLRSVAEGLRRAAAPRDIVARMGGDEFLIVCPEVTASLLGDRLEVLRGALATAVTRAGGGAALTASIGFALYPTDGTTAEDLLALADRRMYLDKQQFYSTNTAASVEPREAVVA